ncbi:putative leucine-rich repeat-containing protein DDB_G0290503 [Vigna unguiculata]|uniref:putative leucine-rich repeat-containing protein DDB_G0290503 n=1 Tax=Vigna unguiculata TaxID=3917 RepID=UPI001015D039|nr:putative leucine-rich repeat-containing protein DDB_G0290503 [Vigna unguiculata]
MEEENQVVSEVPGTKVVVEADHKNDGIKETNGGLSSEVKKEEEENALDGEFIKVEKEENATDDKSHKTERSSDSQSRELLEAQEKIRELDVELQRLTESLKTSEHENNHLREEISVTKQKFEESGKKYEELELSHKKLQEQTVEAENKYNQQLSNLEEALQSQEVKQKELLHVKEAFDDINLELENSRKKMQELQDELKLSADEARKFEELHKQSGSHAESEGKKALEFERLLEEAKLTAKGMEDEMASLKEELKGVYDKISENQKIEEALKTTTAELSTIQEELTLSKSQLLEVEKRLSSRDSLVDELTREVNLIKTSETQLKEDMSALQNLLATSKEELQEKNSELQTARSKLQEEEKLRESIEAALKNQETQFLNVQEELAKLKTENGTLEATMEDLTLNSKKFEKLCAELEEKLKLSDENFHRTDSLLSQALSNNSELELKVKSLEDLHNESGAAAATATQRSLELEGHIQTSVEAAEAAKAQLRDLETRFIAAEQKNLELEQQLNLLQLKTSDADREVTESSEKISHLNAKLEEAKKEKNLLNDQMQEYMEKVAQLESELNQSSLRSSILEEELKKVNDKCYEHEDRATMNHRRSRELEDLIQSSNSKLEDSGKKVSELELLLEADKYRIQELEQQISALEDKCRVSEAQNNKYLSDLSDLTLKLEAIQTQTSTLEVTLQAANEREKELEDSLNAMTDEKKKLEDASSSLNEKAVEKEKLMEILQDDLNLTQSKLQSTESDLRAAELRESEIIKKLTASEENLVIRGRDIEETASRHSELQLLHESRTRDAEQKLQEAIEKFSNKDSEVQSLLEKVKILEELITRGGEQSTSLNNQLEESLSKLSSLESENEVLKRQVLEAESKSAQSVSENELLVGLNIELKTKIGELEESLNRELSEKDAATQELVAHRNSIAQLNDLQSKSTQIQSANESRILEVESQLQEALQRHTEKESETKVLNEKLNTLENQIMLFEEQALKAVVTSGTQKDELEQSLIKLKQLENVIEELQNKSLHHEKETSGLNDENSKLNQEIAIYESKLSDLQSKLSAALAEKDAIEELVSKHSAEVQTLNSQLSSVIDEKNLLNETNQDIKKELQSFILDLEEKLKEKQKIEGSLRSEIEILKIEIAEKSVLQRQLGEIEGKLTRSESRLSEEVGSVQAAASQREAELNSKLIDYEQKFNDRNVLIEKVAELEKELQLARDTLANQKGAESQKLELETALKNSVEEHESKKKDISLLQKQVADLEQKLQLASDKSPVKGDEEGLEVKSRDIGSNLSSPSKRKNKKKSEVPSVQTSSASETHVQSGHRSSVVNYKFVFGVAIVSIVLGIILGKYY